MGRLSANLRPAQRFYAEPLPLKREPAVVAFARFLCRVVRIPSAAEPLMALQKAALHKLCAASFMAPAVDGADGNAAGQLFGRRSYHLTLLLDSCLSCLSIFCYTIYRRWYYADNIYVLWDYNPNVQ